MKTLRASELNLETFKIIKSSTLKVKQSSKIHQKVENYLVLQ